MPPMPDVLKPAYHLTQTGQSRPISCSLSAFLAPAPDTYPTDAPLRPNVKHMMKVPQPLQHAMQIVPLELGWGRSKASQLQLQHGLVTSAYPHEHQQLVLSSVAGRIS